MHRVIVPQVGNAGDRLTITGDEARHAAAVKRVRPGEAIEVLDGRGGIGSAVVVTAEPGSKRVPPSLVVEIGAVRSVGANRPAVHVYSPVPKGDRLAWMIDQLTQAGAATWSPLCTERSVAEPGAARRDRLERIGVEALKQCGRAWAIVLGDECSLPQALSRKDEGPVVIGDAAGAARPAPAWGGLPSLRLLIGPEGGFSAGELDLILTGGASAVRFGPHVMRIETAALAGVVTLLAAGAQ